MALPCSERAAEVNRPTVLDVASTPEQRLPVRAGREVRQSRVEDPASGKLQLVRVFVDRQEGGDSVVTVYRTSKVRKYWSER